MEYKYGCKLPEELEKVVWGTAEHFNVDKYNLWRMYQETMDRNFEQDLWDIANENLTELRGE